MENHQNENPKVRTVMEGKGRSKLVRALISFEDHKSWKFHCVGNTKVLILMFRHQRHIYEQAVCQKWS